MGPTLCPVRLRPLRRRLRYERWREIWTGAAYRESLQPRSEWLFLVRPWAFRIRIRKQQPADSGTLASRRTRFRGCGDPAFAQPARARRRNRDRVAESFSRI